MAFVNLTPHAIVVVVPSGTTTIPASGTLARCKTVNVPVGEVDGVPVGRVTYGDVEGLPAPQEGTYYVVSALVRAAVPGRSDVLSPGDLVRDAAGQVVGCRGLVSN